MRREQVGFRGDTWLRPGAFCDHYASDARRMIVDSYVGNWGGIYEENVLGKDIGVKVGRGIADVGQTWASGFDLTDADVSAVELQTESIDAVRSN